MKQIFLVRHCQATGQEPEAALTEQGAAQAEQLASFFAAYPIDRIISSPYRRALATIEPFACKQGILIETDERLEERVLSSVPRPDWYERLRDTFADLSLKLEGGESSQEAMDRACAVIHELLQSESDQTFVLVTHGCLLALVLKAFDERIGFSDWEQLRNPDVFHLTQSREKWQLTRIEL